MRGGRREGGERWRGRRNKEGAKKNEEKRRREGNA